MSQIIRDDDAGVVYEPYTAPSGALGFKATKGAEVEYILLNPSRGSDDGVACVFVYIGKGKDIEDNEPAHYYTLCDTV